MKMKWFEWLAVFLMIVMMAATVFLSGCSYIIPNSTSVKPAKTELKEVKSIVDPPEEEEIFIETIYITSGGKTFEVNDDVFDIENKKDRGERDGVK